MGDNSFFWGLAELNPYRPSWRLHIGPHFSADQQNAPSAFHRFMQRLFFGFKWERLP